MSWKRFVSATLLCGLASPLFAQPQLNVVPGGNQGGDFVWEVGITPDLVLAGGTTPIALEMGFRLTGASLLSATNINPAEFDTPNPGTIIFGWEKLTDLGNGNFRPVELQTNTAEGEIFVAYGTVNFATPGPKPFLKIVAQGPASGGPSRWSVIEWLGVYGASGGHGRISQLTSAGSAQNFDTLNGLIGLIAERSTTMVAVRSANGPCHERGGLSADGFLGLS